MMKILKNIKDKVKDLLHLKKEKGGLGYADIILENDGGKILLLKRSYQDDFHPGKWSLPGGGIETGELPEDAAKRELLEETNIYISDCELAYVKDINGGKKIYYYRGNVHPGYIQVLENNEHYNYKWVDIGEWNEMDLILDLKNVLNRIVPKIDRYELVREPNPFRESYMIIKKAFDDGRVGVDRYLEAKQLYDVHCDKYKAAVILKKAFDEDLITEDRYVEGMVKAGEIVRDWIFNSNNSSYKEALFCKSQNIEPIEEIQKELRPEIKKVLDQYNDLSKEERLKTTILWWMLGESTAYFKMSKEDSKYVDKSKDGDKCSNCKFIYKGQLGYVCSQIGFDKQLKSDNVALGGWCKFWAGADKEIN